MDVIGSIAFRIADRELSADLLVSGAWRCDDSLGRQYLNTFFGPSNCQGMPLRDVLEKAARNVPNGRVSRGEFAATIR